MKILCTLVLAAFAAMAVAGCRGEAAVDTDGHASTNIGVAR